MRRIPTGLAEVLVNNPKFCKSPNRLPARTFFSPHQGCVAVTVFAVRASRRNPLKLDRRKLPILSSLETCLLIRQLVQGKELAGYRLPKPRFSTNLSPASVD